MISRSLALALLAAAPPAGFDALPQSGSAVEDFVPRGWGVESRHEGDLTRDGVADLVLVLVKKEGEDPGSRALVVLARDRNAWKSLGHNTSLLMCDGCGGIRGGSGAPTISIKSGVLVVGQGGGSGVSYSSSVHRFRLDRKSRRLVLIGHDSEFHDETNGTAIVSSQNLLTGRSVTETWTGGPPPSRHVEQVPKRTPPLEEVKGE